MKDKKILLILLLVLVAVFFYFDLGRFLNLETLKAQQQSLNAYYQANPLLTIGLFFIAYVVVAAFSLPGASIMTLAGGALFGLVVGTIVTSFASTIGATFAFLASRFFLRDWIESKFGRQIQTFNNNIEKDGAFYLFTIRLVPIFPFFLVNLVMGLTKIKIGVFYWVSQLGMLAGTIVFVNAGTQLAKIDSLSGILSPKIILSFALLGIFPLIAKKVIDFFKARKVYEGYEKPETFDRDIVVLGAGAGGLVSAYIAAAVKASVSLIERDKMGGDCLNTGCVPSKALIKTAKLKHQIEESQKYGIAKASAEFNFSDAMNRVHEVVKTIEPHDSVERYTGLGVDCIEGEGKITSPWSVEVNGQTLSTRNIIIATGAQPFVPPIPGLDSVDYLTSDNLWELKELPRKLVVLGGGPIGSELVQAFNRLGSEVWQVEMMPAIMNREDADVSEFITQKFIDEGVHVLTNTKAVAVESSDSGKFLVCEDANDASKTQRIEFDELLVAVGRSARLTGFGLEELGIETNRTVEVNDYLQTKYPNIFAVGDVAGPYQFTHTASHQAWYAAVNSLFGFLKKFKADYRVIPWATFTDPEIARVGLNEKEANEQGIKYEVSTYGLEDLDRAIADSSNSGFIKVLTVPGKDKILGVTLVGEHAGDLIAEYVTAMKYNIGLNKVLGTIHIYPTLAESNKYVAGEWKRANQPERILAWLERFHRWRRGGSERNAPASSIQSHDKSENAGTEILK